MDGGLQGTRATVRPTSSSAHMFGTVGIVLLVALAVALVAIALLDATRGTPVSDVVTRGGPAPACTDARFLAAFEAYTSTALRPGHAIDLLANGDEIFPQLWDDIRAARRFVAFQMYYFAPGRVADALRDALVDRAHAGVEVLFLHDAFGARLPREYRDALVAAGVRVAAFRPFRLHMLHVVGHRAHLRAIVVDARIGWTGGFGIDDKWIGDGVHGEGWRDTAVRFTGPAVAQLMATFGACWAEATGDLLVGAPYWEVADVPATDGGATGAAGPAAGAADDDDGVPVPLAGLLHGAPTVGSTAAERFFALTIAAARERLWITNAYFVPDDDFRRFVMDAARRGVDVRILTSSRRSDVKSTYHAARARYEELMSAGVRLFEYQPVMIHAKGLVMDGTWGSVGSMNIDNRSMAFNNECNLVALDRDLGGRLERMFLADLAHAHEIDPAVFARRGAWQRVLERLAHLLSRIL